MVTFAIISLLQSFSLWWPQPWYNPLWSTWLKPPANWTMVYGDSLLYVNFSLTHLGDLWWPSPLWGGSKGDFNFPWIFYAMRSSVPVENFRNICGHSFTCLVCGSFQWRHGLLFNDCIVWDDKDKVIGWWSTGSPKLQLFQLSQHSHATNCRLIYFSAYFPWNMTLKYKMQLSEGTWERKKKLTF